LNNKPQRTVFFVSESTGITAETLGHSLLSQFPSIEFVYRHRPFIDTLKKAQKLLDEIDRVEQQDGVRPLVFATMPVPEINAMLQQCGCQYYEIFENYLDKLSRDLNTEPSHESGISHGWGNQKSYDTRIDALNYTIMHDDAMVMKNLDEADVIIVGLSRSGKTPTSLYLALKYGIKAANYPITDDDFDRDELPDVLIKNREKLVATTISAQRSHQIREKRRPDSHYSALSTCQLEIKKAHALYARYHLKPLDVTTQSIEELATQIVRQLHLTPRQYATISKETL
jgi:regulator of PEP synthase PpsR (kinase-PPPase family)